MDNIKGSNQGESSNEWKSKKSAVVVGMVENSGGAQSGVTSLISGGDHTVSIENDLGINPGASTENRSAKYKNPMVKQDVGMEGDNQYK